MSPLSARSPVGMGKTMVVTTLVLANPMKGVSTNANPKSVLEVIDEGSKLRIRATKGPRDKGFEVQICLRTAYAWQGPRECGGLRERRRRRHGT